MLRTLITACTKITLMSCLVLLSHQLAASDVLKVGIVEDYMPWEARYNGKAIGINIEIAKRISLDLNRKPKFQSLPFKRLLKYLQSGKIDMACSLALNPERAEYIEFIHPAYGPSTKIFLVKKNANVVIKKYQDLYRYTIGQRIGNKQFPQFDTDEKIKKLEVDDNKQLFKVLMSERVDAIVGTDIHLLHHLKKEGYEDSVKQAEFKILKARSGHCGISKKSEIIQHKEQISQVIKRLLESGSIDNIIVTYFE